MSAGVESVVFPEHFGFCEGVAAADQLVTMVSDEARAAGIETVYGLHDIVHNRDVTNFHALRGVIFVEDVSEIPPNQLVVTSAHGTSPEVQWKLEQIGSTTFDAACPLVLATHKSARRARRNGESLLYICHGKPGEVDKLHDEVEGMVGHLDFVKTPDGVEYFPIHRRYLELGERPTSNLLDTSGMYRIVSQTTLQSSKVLAYREQVAAYIRSQQRTAKVEFTDRGEVCFAVEDRQRGVAQAVELKPRRIVVATDPESANGKSYYELAQHLTDGQPDVTVHAVANAQEAAELGTIEGLTVVTASASTPDKTTLEVAAVLGLREVPEINRRAFSLRDLKAGVVREKIQRHKELIGV